jgi:hypothetical protein
MVYDYVTPVINRQIELIVTDGFQTDPAPGVRMLVSNTDFVITITPPPTQPDLKPEVTTSREAEGDVLLSYDATANIWQARVYRVQSNFTVSIKASDPTGNVAVASYDTPLIWAYKGKLHVVCRDVARQVSTPYTVKVFTFAGIQIIDKPLTGVETIISLEKGLYIVKVGATTRKVVVSD